VRVAELIEYTSRLVPEQTAARQNPRIAGNFDAAMPLAALPAQVRRDAAESATLHLTGSPNTAIYLDRQFLGSIRPTGDLWIETVPGPHVVSADPPGREPLDHSLTLAVGRTELDLQKLRGPKTSESALEDTGMECISDYVQSTTNALKRQMFLQAAEAFTALRALRPGDPSLQAKALFCQARAQIAANEFPQAIQTLNRSIAVDPRFACSYNALGVALSRLGRNQEARSAFEMAAKLAPVWALPPFEIARQLVNAGDLRGAVPFLESAARLNPRAIGIQWSLARAHRLLGNGQAFLNAANQAIAVDRNYAPIYSELGLFYESLRDPVRAAQAYDNYLLLAPNFTDSAEIRKRLQSIRSPAPTLRKK